MLRHIRKAGIEKELSIVNASAPYFGILIHVMKRSGLRSLLGSFCFRRCFCSCFLLSLCLQGSLFAFLSFLSFLHLKTLLDLLFLLSSVKNILNCAGRALGGTQTALDALLGIDLAEIVLNRDRALRADFRALSASDTCDITAFPCIGAFLFIVAAYLDLRGLRNDLDQLLRACLRAGTAARAVIAADNSDTVDDASEAALCRSL